MSFSDNFNRADGNLGANWTSPNNWVHIASNQAVASSTSYAHCTAFSEAGAQTVSATFSIAAAISTNCYVHVKSNDAENAYYSGQIAGTSGNITATINSVAHGGAIATVWTPISVGASYKLTLAYNNGFLTLYVDDVAVCWAKDSTYANQTRCAFGLPLGSYACTLFEAAGVSTATFRVLPNATVTSGPPITLQLTGTGTAWTPGSPGSPTFTASAGTLSDQSVSTTGAATITFTPPVVGQVVTITDPSTNLTATVDVNATGTAGGGAPSPFTSEFVDLANRTGDADVDNGWLGTLLNNKQPSSITVETTLDTALGDLIVKMNSTVGDPGTAPAGEGYLPDIYARLWGGEEWQGVSFVAPGSNSVMDLLTQAKTILDTLTAVNTQTLQTTVDALGGTPTLYSHADIMTALGNISGGDNQDVLDALAAYFGQSPPTIEQLGTMVSNLATIAGYDLGDVLDAIAAIPATDLSPVTAKLADIQPSTSYNLSTITTDVGGVAANATTILADLVALTSTGAISLQDVLDAVGAIPTTTYEGPPVWPGVDYVDLGSQVALVDGMTITGAMDGVIVNVTGAPSGAGKYVFGSVKSWKHVGGIVFVNDNGNYERAESFGLDSQILTPKTMQQASGCIVRLNGGWSGTIQPWVISTS